jgi:hypothetical protein
MEGSNFAGRGSVPRSSTDKQLVAGICALVIGFALLLGGVIASGWRYLTYRGSEGWPKTAGTVVSAKKLSVDDDGDVDWTVRIRYQYTVGGVRRTAQTVGLGFVSGQTGFSADLEHGAMPLFNEEEPASALVARYPKGAVVEVYYHPDDPEVVCLERGDPEVSDIMMAYFIPLFWGGMLLLTGVTLIIVRY